MSHLATSMAAVYKQFLANTYKYIYECTPLHIYILLKFTAISWSNERFRISFYFAQSVLLFLPDIFLLSISLNMAISHDMIYRH